MLFCIFIILKENKHISCLAIHLLENDKTRKHIVLMHFTCLCSVVF